MVYKTHTQTHISLIHVVEVITQVIIVIMRSDAMQLRITLFRYNWKILIDTDCKKAENFDDDAVADDDDHAVDVAVADDNGKMVNMAVM